MATITLRAGREKPLRQRHPWIFSGAIAAVHSAPAPGAAVEVYADDGEWLARATWSGASQIRARVFSWDADEPLDRDLFRNRLQRAIAARRALGFADAAPDAAYRLVYAESDGLPGLIVDRYGEFLVVQLLTQGVALRAELIFDLLDELLAPRGIYERSDAEVREKEGLPPVEGLRRGEPPPACVALRTLPAYAGAPSPRLLADLCGGQKTGFYLDQALNRTRVASYCAAAEVLDCFCYTGGFSVFAAAAGAAMVTAVDSSAAALAFVGENLVANGLAGPVELVEADVFQLLRRYRGEGRRFDLIVLDPPKFAHRSDQVVRATRGYKDINLLAFQLLRPGGVLATFSCSGLVSADLFQKVVFGAALDAGREAQIVERLSQSPDHPVLLTFPEGEYLKGLVCRVW